MPKETDPGSAPAPKVAKPRQRRKAAHLVAVEPTAPVETTGAGEGTPAPVATAPILHLVPELPGRHRGGRGEMTPALASIERARIEDEAVDAMNEHHAAVMLGSNVQIVSLDPHDGSFRMTNFRALSEWLASRPLFVPVTNERSGRVETKRICRATTWKNHERRRNVRELIFAPEKDLGPDVFNTWQGWRVTPLDDDGAAAAPIISHIHEIWCGRRADLSAWMMAWMAQMIQDPCNKTGTALVLRGKEGAGKGIIAGALMRRIVGNAYVQITQPSQVTSRFNVIWQSKLAVFCDEAFWAGDKPAEGVLKTLITEPKINIEMKGKDYFEIDHHARVIFATNSDWAVPAGPEARRYCVGDVSEERLGDVEYFKTLQACIDGDGARSFFAYLMKLDYSKFNLRMPPVTGGLLDQKVHSLESVPAWWRERLWTGYMDTTDGRVFDSLSSRHETWPSEIPCEIVYASYLAFCGRTGSTRYKLDQASFSKKLRDLANVDRTRRRGDGVRTYLYVFQGDSDLLSSLRGQFEQWIGGALEWEGDGPRVDHDAGAAEEARMAALSDDEFFQPAEGPSSSGDCPF